jgi:hypothetical protein
VGSYRNVETGSRYVEIQNIEVHDNTDSKAATVNFLQRKVFRIYTYKHFTEADLFPFNSCVKNLQILHGRLSACHKQTRIFLCWLNLGSSGYCLGVAERSKTSGGAGDVGRTTLLEAVTVWEDETQIYFQAVLRQVKMLAYFSSLYNKFAHF